MKHARVLNGQAIEFADFEQGTAPMLAANKGQWQPVAELAPPEITEDQTYNQVSYTDDGTWCITYAVRPLSELEKWLYHEFVFRIIAPKQLIFTSTGIGMKVWFDLNGLPVILKGEFVHLYCNTILQEHQDILVMYQDQIEIEHISELL